MKLEDFAKQAGCVVSLNLESEGWGGKWQYHSKDCSQLIYVGFRTEKAAYKAFLEDEFGTKASKAVLKLLRKVEILEKKNRELRFKE